MYFLMFVEEFGFRPTSIAVLYHMFFKGRSDRIQRLDLALARLATFKAP